MSATPDPAKATGKTLAKTWAKPHRPRVGWHPGAQYPAAALVAVDVLRDDHLVDRLLGRLSVLASYFLLQRRPVPLAYPQLRREPACGAPAGARRDDDQAFRRVAERDRNHTGIARFRAGARPARLRGQLRALSRRRWRRRQGLSQPER